MNLMCHYIDVTSMYPCALCQKRKKLVASKRKKFSQIGMIFLQVVFSEGVGEVMLALFPIKLRLLLLLPVFKLVALHVNTFYTSLLQSTIDKSFNCSVINLHRHRKLRIAYFNQSFSYYCSILAILEGSY